MGVCFVFAIVFLFSLEDFKVNCSLKMLSSSLVTSLVYWQWPLWKKERTKEWASIKFTLLELRCELRIAWADISAIIVYSLLAIYSLKSHLEDHNVNCVLESICQWKNPKPPMKVVQNPANIPQIDRGTLFWNKRDDHVHYLFCFIANSAAGFLSIPSRW